MKRAVFIDKDGVINKGIDRGAEFKTPTAPWLYSELEIYKGVSDALKALGDAGYLRIIVTNQPDITYGYMTEDEWKKIESSIRHLPLDDVFVCFHGRGEGCKCKKPAPGMLRDAAKKWDIDFSESYIVGDTINDIEAGKVVGVTTILVDTPYNQDVESDMRVKSFVEASERIVNKNI